jgi:hypothetical protein
MAVGQAALVQHLLTRQGTAAPARTHRSSSRSCGSAAC